MPRARLVVLFVIWCVVTIVAVVHHEPWRDEADAWLVARERSLDEIWQLMAYAGTPWLWYLVELPFAKLLVAYHWQQIIHWPIAAAAAAVVIFRSPFSLFTRALIVGSYFVVYEYSVIARGYSLTLLFLFLACSFSRARKAPSFGLEASLGVLANTTSLGLFFACAFQLWAFVELVIDVVRGRARLTFRHVLAKLTGWSGTFIALLQLFPQPTDGQKGPSEPNVDALLTAIADGIAPFGTDELRYVVVALWLASILWLLRSSWLAVAFFLTSSALFSYLFYAVHAGHLRHWGFFVIAAIAARWIALESANVDERAELQARRGFSRGAHIAALTITSAVLVGWCVRGGEQLIAEVREPFSNAQDMAAFIKKSGLEKRVIAGHRAEVAMAILPWFPEMELWYPGLQRFGTHMPWDRSLRVSYTIRQPAALRRVKRTFTRWADPTSGVLLLLSAPLPNAREEGFTLLHASDAKRCSAFGESFWLYKAMRVELPKKKKPKKTKP